MISRELSEKLKVAGLRWDPGDGDVYYCSHCADIWCDRCYFEYGTEEDCEEKDFVFAPSLSQLLAGIENRGYWWTLENHEKGYGFVLIYLVGDKTFINADTPEEAAGQALLWILIQEGGSNA